MNVWWNESSLLVAVIKHNLEHGSSGLYVEPNRSGRSALFDGKLRAKGDESTYAVPVVTGKNFVAGDYIIFAQSGPITKHHPEFHGWITKIVKYNVDEILTAPAIDRVDGTDIIHSPQSMVLKDFFIVSPYFPVLAGWEKSVTKPLDANVCPGCGGSLTCFRLARYCAACNKVQVTDTWGKNTTWQPVL